MASGDSIITLLNNSIDGFTDELKFRDELKKLFLIADVHRYLQEKKAKNGRLNHIPFKYRFLESPVQKLRRVLFDIIILVPQLTTKNIFMLVLSFSSI